MNEHDKCRTCGHSRCFHQIGRGRGVPVGQKFCYVRYADPCDCREFLPMTDYPSEPAACDQIRIAHAIRDDARAVSARDLEAKRKVEAELVEAKLEIERLQSAARLDGLVPSPTGYAGQLREALGNDSLPLWYPTLLNMVRELRASANNLKVRVRECEEKLDDLRQVLDS